MSTGGKWVSTRVPSIPSHMKVWCGNLLTRFQEIFWVRNHLAPASADDLGQCRRIAERVGQPDLLAHHPELVVEEPLTVGELPGHRLGADHVGVGFHPHAADRDEPALGHRLGHAFEHLRPMFLDPGVLLGRGHRVDQIGILGQQVQLVGRGPGDLADGLAGRPQPGGVDVGVADSGDLVRAGVRRLGERRGQDLAGPIGACRLRRSRRQVHRLVQRQSDLCPPRVGLGQCRAELVQHVDVGRQLPDLLVETVRSIRSTL